MTCACCGQTNPAGSRFCSGCGSSLAPRCSACDTECLPGARFCNHCGAPLGTRLAPAAVSRKIVTIVFADLIGSVSLHERLEAESARRVMDRYHRAMATAVAVHGGRVVQLLGDGVLAAFGVPPTIICSESINFKISKISLVGKLSLK
jgi:class 3 adenylate cyclase